MTDREKLTRLIDLFRYEIEQVLDPSYRGEPLTEEDKKFVLEDCGFGDLVSK